MRFPILGILFLLSLTILPLISAQEEYQNGYPIYGDDASTHPTSPKIACEADNSMCLALVYDAAAGANGQIAILKTIDNWKTYNDAGAIVKAITTADDPYIDFNNANHGLLGSTYSVNYTQLPYDIWQNSATPGEYYIMTPQYVWRYNILTPSTLTKVWAFNQTYQGLIGIVDKNSNYPKVVAAEWPLSQPNLYFKTFWLTNGTYIETLSTSSHSFFPLGGPNNCLRAGGFVGGEATGSDLSYYVYVRYIDAGGCAGAFGAKYVGELPSFPVGSCQTYDTTTPCLDPISVFYWDGSDVYYRRAENATLGINNSIWVASTSDMDSFSNNRLYYTFNSSIDERIEMADFSSESKYMVVYDRYSNKTWSPSDSNSPGVYGWPFDRFPVIVRSYVKRSNDSIISQPNSIVTFTSSNFTSTQSGSYLTFQLPNSTGNVMGLQTTDGMPASNTTTITLPCTADGEYSQIAVVYLGRTNVTLVAIDEHTLNPIPSANIEVIGAGTATTNANGEALLQNLNPWTGTYFNITSSGCVISYTSTASPKTYSVNANATNYNPAELAPYTFSAVSGINPIFYGRQNIYLRPISTVLRVSFYTKNSISWTPVSGSFYISGADDFEFILQPGNTPVNQDFISLADTQFPLYIIVNESNSSVSVTMNLTIGGVTEVRTITLTKYAINNYDFVSNYTSYELPCYTNSDCPTLGCTGLTFRGNGQCVNSICSYQAQTCGVLCDSKIGCYDTSLADACTRDSECADECVDYKTVLNKKCGADGFCKGTYKTCSGYCNETVLSNTTVGYCSESEACVLGTSEKIFSILYKGPNGIDKPFNGRHVCNSQNAGKSACVFVNPIEVEKADVLGGFAGISTDPSEWSVIDNITKRTWDFSAVSATCSEGCEMTWDFCPSGCNTLTGKCKTTSSTIASLVTTIPEYLQWLVSSFFLWIVLTFIVGGILTFIPVKFGQHVSEKMGLAGIFIMTLVGTVFGFVPAIIGVMIMIGLGLWLARTLSGGVGGD